MKKLLLIAGFVTTLLVGCTDLNTTAFRTEALAAKTSVAGVKAYKAYYIAATNGASPLQIDVANQRLNMVYDSSRRLGLSLQATEKLRQDFETASNDTNKTALQISLQVLSANITNLVTTIQEVQR